MAPVGVVRPATAADVRFIESWLPKDYSVGTLAMNWHITKKVFEEGGVSVWEDAATGKPVAYCWGSLNSHDSVLEVQPEFRGTGVGRAMAEFMIENCLAKRDPLLEIHIAPDTAEEFWQRMGFEIHWDYDKCYGRRLLELPQPIVSGKRRSVTVTFLPDGAEWSANVNPLELHQLVGTEVAGGNIVLEKTAAHFRLQNGDHLVIEVRVDGQSRYRGRAKREAAKAIGVVECKSGFMISEIIDDEL